MSGFDFASLGPSKVTNQIKPRLGFEQAILERKKTFEVVVEPSGYQSIKHATDRSFKLSIAIMMHPKISLLTCDDAMKEVDQWMDQCIRTLESNYKAWGFSRKRSMNQDSMKEGLVTFDDPALLSRPDLIAFFAKLLNKNICIVTSTWERVEHVCDAQLDWILFRCYEDGSFHLYLGPPPIHEKILRDVNEAGLAKGARATEIKRLLKVIGGNVTKEMLVTS